MISVFALMMPDVVNTATLPYSWACFVDMVPATPLGLQQLTEPTTVKICGFTDLTDGPHQLTFQFNIPGVETGIDNAPQAPASGALYFDYIEYLPLRSTTPQTFSLIAVSFDDEALMYDNTWSNTTLDDGTMGMIALPFLSPDYAVQLQFNGLTVYSPSIENHANTTGVGSSATWIGFLAHGVDAVATYTIDSQPHVQFSLPQYTSNKSINSQPGRIFFETTLLDATVPHNMTLRYSPSNNSTWQQMSVQSIIIGNGTVPALISNTTAAPSTPTSASSPLSTAAQTQHTQHRPKPSQIIAGVLTGVFAVAFMIALIILHRRRSRRQTQRPHIVQAFSSQPSSLFARLITFPSVMTIDIKGRRRLLPEPAPPGVIPPSKLTARPTGTSMRVTQEEQDPVLPETDNAQAEEDIVNVQDPPVRVIRTRDIQEEDSGLRLVEQGSDGEEEIIRVLPPVYTAI